MAEKTDSQMPMRTLGQTGVKVSLIDLGGWHLGFKSIDEELSIRIIRTAIDNGVNFMDNCWDYNEGASEVQKLMFWAATPFASARGLRKRFEELSRSAG